jgi:hypothetical protein
MIGAMNMRNPVDIPSGGMMIFITEVGFLAACMRMAITIKAPTTIISVLKSCSVGLAMGDIV